MSSEIKWLENPKDKHFDSAQEYLSLIMWPIEARTKIQQLRYASNSSFKAKDILRASKLSLLPKRDEGVDDKMDKIEDEEWLAPVLLVRGQNQTLIIADGYHRVCASYYVDENTEVPCRIV